MKELTLEQITNWRRMPCFESLSDDEIRAKHQEFQSVVDAQQTCDALIDGVRCGKLIVKCLRLALCRINSVAVRFNRHAERVLFALGFGLA